MRRLLGLLVLLLTVWGTLGAGVAASDAPVTLIVKPTDREGDLARILETLRKQGRPVIVRTEGVDPGSAGTPSRIAPQASGDPPMMSTMLGEMSGRAMRRRLIDEVQAIAAIPATLQDVAASWMRVRNGTPLLNALAVLAVVAGAVTAAIVAHAWLRRLMRQRLRCGNSRFNTKLGAVAAYMAIDGGALLAALAAGQGLIAALLPDDDVPQMLAVDLVEWFLIAGLYWLVGRVLVSPQAPANRLMPLPHAGWHFRMFVAYGFIGFTITLIAHFVGHTSGNRLGVQAMILLAGAIVTVFKIWWFWTSRRDTTAALLAFTPGGGPPGVLRRIGATAWPLILIVVALLIFLTSQLSLNSPQFAELGKAAGLTQLLVFLLPALAGGVDAVLHDLASRQPPHWHPVRRALPTAARALLLASLWFGGLFVIIRTWSRFFVDMDGRAVAEMIATLALVATILVVGLTVWVFLRTLMDSYSSVHRRVPMPGGEDDLVPVETRLGTVLPLLRGLILGTVVAVTGLMALSYLGVNISPLLAGAGVIGLAISFGSQALIRDIMSGIFFMADDAFRVGEYIDTGRLRGTVEKITLRSAQLRHQNGQVHTVPFGQLMAVTNFSRDWATVKFTIRLEHGSDLEKARKVIKKVGLDLLDDPELGGDFILPLKLQGVADITDNALIVRLKFTAKPVRPTWLQREAMKRIYVALRSAGIAFATGAVTVRSQSPEAPDPRLAAAANAVPVEAVPKVAAQ